MDEVREICTRLYYPSRLNPLQARAPIAFRVDTVRIGPLMVGTGTFGAEMSIATADLATSYHVQLPVSGHVEAEHRRNAVTSTPARAAVYQPVGRVDIRRWSADCRTYSVKIDRRALENHLEMLLGHPVATPLRLAPSLDVASGAGRTWAGLVRMVGDEIGNRDGLVYEPLVTERLSHGMLTGLLLAVEHPYRDALVRPVPPCLPRSVGRAVDAMQANPDRAFTMAQLAEVAGASARSLQKGFRRHVGVAPMAYLRGLRLARAHEELRGAAGRQVTVADIAYRWGFPHLGRFAAEYRRKYGVCPSRTLRDGQ